MAVAIAPGKPKYGGHDHKFVLKVPEELICNICTKPLLEPHLTVCCGQYYCESCLKYWFNKHKNESCPHCRVEGENFQHVPNKAINRKINELKIHCTNHKSGCPWVGELGNSQFHLKFDKGCGYVEVSCTNKCGEKMKRKDLNEHTHSHCLLRQYKCKYCGHKDTYHAITAECGSKRRCYAHYTSHYQKCPNYPQECPNKCSKVIKRKDMHEHHLECPLETVECPFKDAGCNTTLVRKEFESHMTLNTQQHLLLVMGSHQTLIQKYRKLEDKVENLESTVRDLEISRINTFATVETLLETCTEDQKPHLQIVKAVVQSYHLRKRGDSITITMTNFSHYKQSGKVWHSQPFYYKEGYKLCLEVHATSGVGSGADSHVSLSLLLMKGEFDDKLEWPIAFGQVDVLLRECQVYGGKKFLSTTSVPFERVWGFNQVVKRDELFASPHFVSNCVRNDSLTFNVFFGYYYSHGIIQGHSVKVPKTQATCIFSH